MAPRKATSKTSSKTVAVKPPVKKVDSESHTVPQTKRSRRTLLFIVGGVLVIAAFLFLVQRYLVAATVNGQMISRLALYKELEKQYGSQTLDGMITKALVKQEAKNRGITVSSEDIDNEFKKIEERFTSQGQNLDDVLKSQGYSKDDLREQVELQLIVEKMVADKISITDEEVDKYLTENKQFMPTGTPDDKLKEDARENLKQEKINTEGQNIIKELRDKANIKTSFSLSAPQ
jgi:foldase protein PrsA